MDHPSPARASFLLDRTELRHEGTITDQRVATTGPRGTLLDQKEPIPDIINPVQDLRGSILGMREPMIKA